MRPHYRPASLKPNRRSRKMARMNANVTLYSAVGEELTHYEVDVEGAVLVRRKTIKVPAVVQYAWPHPSKRYLYVATSNRGAGMKADFHHGSERAHAGCGKHQAAGG